jgi:hypothetical protein
MELFYTFVARYQCPLPGRSALPQREDCIGVHYELFVTTGIVARPRCPGSGGDNERSLVAPDLTLATTNAPGRVQRPHEMTSELRSLVQAGAQWYPRPDLPLGVAVTYAFLHGRPEADFSEVAVHSVHTPARPVRSCSQNPSATVCARRTLPLGKNPQISRQAPAEETFMRRAARAQGRLLQSIIWPRVRRGYVPLPRDQAVTRTCQREPDDECWLETLAGPHPQAFPTLILPRFSSSPLLRECITGSRGGYCRSFLL